MSKIVSAEEAVKQVKDGDIIIFAADGMVGFPNELVDAVRDRYLKEGHPAGITSFRSSGMGDFTFDKYGEEAWCVDGLLTRSISSYVSVAPGMGKLIEENKIQGYMFPLGPMMQATSEAARGMPGVLSKVGLGTFMDERYGGGKLNKLTEEEGEDFVKYIPDFEGEEYLWYRAPKFNVCLLRATTADSHGNLSCEKETERPGMLPAAQAVKTNGGIVIAQVEKIAGVNDIHPRMVEVPGIYVDYIVVETHPEDVPQTMARFHREDFNPAFTGEKIVSLKKSKEKMPLNVQKVIARRAALEVPEVCNANFGIGMPQNVPTVLEEIGKGKHLTMISETGVIGGVPAQGRDFGNHYNPESFTDRGIHFSYFDGGNLDIGIFGFSEVDRDGSMNTSHLNGHLTGIGGFTDISSSTDNVVFMGTFAAKGFKAEIKDGKLNILQEGQYKKFIEKCAKVSFNGQQFFKNHESYLIITERAVIRVKKEGMILEEIAPGVDLQTQVLDMSDIDFIIPEGGPKLMDAGIFTEDGFTIDGSL
ncbi:MAG: malonate decarboxylase subunit alpha [Anaerovoracaceae bacterium]